MINYVALMGRVTKQIEVKESATGVKYCKFSIAVEQKFKNKETGKYDCDFIDLVAYRGTAEFIGRYFADKGTMIAVEGSLRQSSWTDNDGKKRYSYVVNVDAAHFCGGKSDSAQSDTAQTAPAQTETVETLPDENIPF